MFVQFCVHIVSGTRRRERECRETRHTVFFNPKKFIVASLWEGTRERHSVFAKRIRMQSSQTARRPLYCVERVIPQRKETTIHQRSSTPRFDPRIVLKCRACAAPAGCFEEPLETACGTLSEAPSLNNAAKEEGSFQVDLRVYGVPQDDIYKDEERMTEMQNLVDGLQDGISRQVHHQRLETTRHIQGVQQGSKRKLKDMGHIQLYELSEPVRTT